MKRVAIIAAMAGELKPLIQCGFTKVPTSQKTVHLWRMETTGVEWIAACAGMGAEAARRAFAAAEAGGKLDGVISMGWVGALQENIYARNFLIPNVVVDAQTGERFILAEREKNTVLVTAAHVADESEKRRLAASYNADAVDMESAAVVRLAEMRDIPVCCMKVVTDEVGLKLPDLNRFIDKMGQMQMSKFLCYIALRPQYWAPLAKLGKASEDGAKYLSSAIFNFMNREVHDLNFVNQLGDIPDRYPDE